MILKNNGFSYWKGSVILFIMSAALANENFYTIDDIYALPDGKRAELIDGQIYYMAPPTRKHQRIVGEIFATIREYIHRNKGTCEVNIAPFSVFLNENQKNYVEPDISVICDPNKLNDKGCIGAPDWVIEIVSPSSQSMDYYTKLFKYRTAGVKEYWIVDHIRNLVTVYDFQHGSAANYDFSDNIPVGIYPEFSINLSILNI